MAENRQSWTPIEEAIDELWNAFLLPPKGSLSLFCTQLMDHEHRFPPAFLQNFINMFDSLRGCPPVEELSDPLKAIVNKAGRNCEFVWNSKDDAEYEIPKSMMMDLFDHVIEETEREGRQKLTMKQKIEEVDDYEDEWMGNQEEMEMEKRLTEEMIEENKMKMRKQWQKSFEQRGKANKASLSEGKRGRKVMKEQASTKNKLNRLKNSFKRN